MTITLLRGATEVRRVVATYLQNTVPQIVTQARADWGLTDIQLPMPVKYDAYEPYALGQWPLIGVAVAQAAGFDKIDFNPDASHRYLTKYQVRVFTWVRTPVDEDEVPIEPEYSEAIRVRDDLSACVRAALLRTGDFDQDGAGWDESTLSEDYSETDKVKGDRWVSSTAHAFQMTYDESVPLTPLGRADGIYVHTAPWYGAIQQQTFAASLAAVCNVS